MIIWIGTGESIMDLRYLYDYMIANFIHLWFFLLFWKLKLFKECYAHHLCSMYNIY